METGLRETRDFRVVKKSQLKKPAIHIHTNNPHLHKHVFRTTIVLRPLKEPLALYDLYYAGTP